METSTGGAGLFMPDLGDVSPGMMDSEGGHIFWVVKGGSNESKGDHNPVISDMQIV